MSRHWFICLVVMMVGCASNRHSQMGLSGGRLAACPDSPNCVSSQSADPRHAIDPLRYEGTAQKARERLVKAISGMKRARIVTAEERYIHAEFTSALFRFVGRRGVSSGRWDQGNPHAFGIPRRLFRFWRQPPARGRDP